MTCDQCEGIETSMSPKIAKLDLKIYRKKGARGATKVLLDALELEGEEGKTLLDIGGGVGAIQHHMLQVGAAHATCVDAASEYLIASKEEAERQGHSDRLSQYFGNFVELAHEIEAADIVTLDKVLCCFDNMRELVRLSAEHATKIYALIYPRDRWWVNVLNSLENVVHRLRRSQFRSFVHTTDAVDAIVRAAGLKPHFRHDGMYWQVVIYRR